MKLDSSKSNYALGCAFTLDQILMNFPYNKLSLTCQECKNIIGDNHRQVLVRRIFTECFKIVIDDIINNNITFWLPLTGQKKCNLHMRRVQGDEFKNMRKHNKWGDVDIIQSMFSGCEIGMFMLGNRTPRVKTVYVDNNRKNIITDNTNKGMPYGDSKYDKTIKDYYSIMYEKFPQVPKADMNRILIFSWKSIYLHNSYGGDVIIKSRDLWCYIGNLNSDSLKHFHYYIKKLIIKLRVLYRRKRVQWDGYYYFALTEHQYGEYIQQRNSRGRPRKYFKFNNIYLYQILDECKINEYSKKYIFRIPYISRLKIKVFLQQLITDKAELIDTREPLKFKDILVNYNDYMCL